MRPWFLLLLIPLVPSVAAQTCDALTLDNVEPCQAEAVERAMAFLADGPRGYLGMEAAAAAGMDLGSWPDRPLRGTMVLEAPEGIAGGPIRLVGAAAASGYDVRAYPTPDGPVDLVAMLEANHEAVMASQSTAAKAWHAIALQVAGADPALRGAAVDAILAAQNPDGGWPCMGGGSNLDCTGFVAAAVRLDLDHQARMDALAFIEAHRVGGGYAPSVDAAEPNAQTTAWAVTALYHWKIPYQPDLEVIGFLLSMQDEDGSFRLSPSEEGITGWVTAEVVPALSWPHPAKHYEPFQAKMEVTPTEVGAAVRLTTDAAQATWTIGGVVHEGAEVEVELGPGLHAIHVHMEGGGHARDIIHLVVPAGDEEASAPGFLVALIAMGLAGGVSSARTGVAVSGTPRSRA